MLRKPLPTKRSRLVAIRLNSAEHQQLLETADALGLTLSSLLRQAGLQLRSTLAPAARLATENLGASSVRGRSPEGP
jgi:hypothetical protein